MKSKQTLFFPDALLYLSRDWHHRCSSLFFKRKLFKSSNRSQTNTRQHWGIAPLYAHTLGTLHGLEGSLDFTALGASESNIVFLHARRQCTDPSSQIPRLPPLTTDPLTSSSCVSSLTHRPKAIWTTSPRLFKPFPCTLKSWWSEAVVATFERTADL